MCIRDSLAVFAYDFDDGVGNLLEIILKESWKSPETAVLALFLLLAGICGAVILVQGIRLLASVADGTPFSPKNAVYLQRAAAGCFVIAAGALGRTAFTLCRDGAAALLSYTCLLYTSCLPPGWQTSSAKSRPPVPGPGS